MMRLFFLIGAVHALRRFRLAAKGSAAVEFALVAPMFLALLFAIIETGLMFFAGQVLENGTQDTGRAFYLSQKVTAEEIKTNLCGRVKPLLDCNKISLELQSFPQGAAITLADPIPGGKLADKFVFVLPKSGTSETVVFRAFYVWPLYVTGLGYNLTNSANAYGDKGLLLAATAAFRPQ
jgi:Flp pilus assembly protein TadG